MGNNFSKRKKNEMAELHRELHDSTVQGLTKTLGPQAKTVKKNLKTLHSLGDLKMKEIDGYSCYKIDRNCSGPGCSKYWSFLPRL